MINRDSSQRRSRAIGALIRHNRGVVIAEQIYPYLDTQLLQGQKYGDKSRDEEDMFPLLARFNGVPAATEDGHLVYKFPALKTSVPNQNGMTLKDEDVTDAVIPPPIYEERWEFSAASETQIQYAIGLGFFNLFEYFLLIVLANRPYALFQLVTLGRELEELPSVANFALSCSWLILPYAILYLVIPTLRYFVIQVLNQRIQQRNQVAMFWQ